MITAESAQLREAIRLGDINTDTERTRSYWEYAVARIYFLERHAEGQANDKTKADLPV